MLKVVNGKLPMVPQAKPGPPPLPVDPTDDADPDLDPDHDGDIDMKGGMVPQQNAGYMGPENGPFECQNCGFFNEPNSCEVVTGSIDPKGCCNNYTPDKDQSEDEGPDEDENVDDTTNYGQ